MGLFNLLKDTHNAFAVKDLHIELPCDEAHCISGSEAIDLVLSCLALFVVRFGLVSCSRHHSCTPDTGDKNPF